MENVEDIEIGFIQVLNLENLKKSISNDSLWCLKDILEELENIDVKYTYTAIIGEVESCILNISISIKKNSNTLLISNFYGNKKTIITLEKFTEQLRISKKLFNLFLDKLETIVKNINEDLFKVDETILITMMLEMVKKITRYCDKDIEYTKALLEDITAFNKKYEEI